ncbi:MAG: SDR family oxidoreductase [Actinomycetia bacterium]|nr:SDR family oxidoreductase [Actinomycetes bacterium]
MGRLDGKTTIITGAARGQGAAEARLFAAEGASVVLTDVISGPGQEVADEIGGTFVHHDVSNEEAWERVVAATLEAHGRIDGRPFCPGFPVVSGWNSRTEGRWDQPDPTCRE